MEGVQHLPKPHLVAFPTAVGRGVTRGFRGWRRGGTCGAFLKGTWGMIWRVGTEISSGAVRGRVFLRMRISKKFSEIKDIVWKHGSFADSRRKWHCADFDHKSHAIHSANHSSFNLNPQHLQISISWLHLESSWVRGFLKMEGTPESLNSMGFSTINHPFWGLWKPPIVSWDVVALQFEAGCWAFKPCVT